jgi:hypothetical protein
LTPRKSKELKINSFSIDFSRIVEFLPPPRAECALMKLNS